MLVYTADVNQGHFKEAITNEAAYGGIASDKGIHTSSVVNVNDSSGGSSTQKGSAKIHKLGDDGQPLAGATFSLYTIDNKRK